MSDAENTDDKPPARVAKASPVVEAPAVVAPPRTLPVEEWARMKHTHPTTLRAAAVSHHWEIGPQVAPWMITEADYDRAVAFAENPHAVVNAPKKG